MCEGERERDGVCEGEREREVMYVKERGILNLIYYLFIEYIFDR